MARYGFMSLRFPAPAFAKYQGPSGLPGEAGHRRTGLARRPPRCPACRKILRPRRRRCRACCPSIWIVWRIG